MEPIHRSLFHLQILKCRQLIFLQSSCLASPVKCSTSHIRIIVPIPTFNSIDFKECIRKLDLEIIDIKETTPTALQECLQYTCAAKLAPDWNVLQDFFIEGQRFLTDNGPLNSVKMEIFVSNKEISLCLLPSCIRFPPMRMEYYATDEQLAKLFMIPVKQKCVVFPSLKTANLLSISRSSKPCGSFKTYSELQEHWKNMYGYILPPVPKEKNIWYFNVTFRVPNSTPYTFRVPNSTPYTYPQFCVRSHGPNVVPRVDPRPILATFIKTFCKKVTNICGEKCRIIEGKASFPELGLFLAEDILEDMKPRPGTTYAMKTNVPYRKDLPKINPSYDKNVHTKNTQNKLYCVGSPASVPQPKNILPERVQNKVTSENLIIPNSEKARSQAQDLKQNLTINSITPIAQSANVPSQIPLVTTTNSIEMAPVKYAPCFFPKKPKPIQNPLKADKKTVYAPKFVPTKRLRKKQIQVSKANCKIPTVNTKLKNSASSVTDPAQVNTVLNCFNIKKKIPDVKISAQPVKRASTGEKQAYGNITAEKKVKRV
ncbi:hypothetical protein JTE90_011649 [Oedothorax gibbosus]|uniref:DUF4708 domain-containing protein n=1 Tax=Oedothorax gibbosus TaxID=931172 RepID=A0AAV6U251_9ARAC|nr:hypothetical protein JTE90_011649 [Oedothorax gibbosus]